MIPALLFYTAIMLIFAFNAYDAALDHEEDLKIRRSAAWAVLTCWAWPIWLIVLSLLAAIEQMSKHFHPIQIVKIAFKGAK